MSNSAKIFKFRPREVGEERSVANLDDGYMRIATSIGKLKPKLKLAGRQHQVFDAVIHCTYGWNKSEDRVTNTFIAELTDLDDSDVADALDVLAERRIINLKKSGGFKIVSVNVNLDQWQLTKTPKTLGISTQNVGRKKVSGWAKTPDTLNSLTKDNKNTPLTPKGEFSEEVVSQAKQVLEYYNELTGTTCRSAEAFAVLLTPRSARDAYTVDDLKLVVLWVVLTWKRRNGTVAKPANICRVSRFDGYLADAAAWASSYVEIDCGAVVDAYNEIAGDRLPLAELDDDREKAIRDLVTHMTHKNIDAVRAYFKAFVTEARPHYFGENPSGWRANFDFLMKPDTLRKVRERAL